MTERQITESDDSLAARAAANELGTVEGASYSRFEDRPVLWAFDIDADGRRLVLAGGESLDPRVVLFHDGQTTLTWLIYAKAVIAACIRDEEFEPPSVVLIGETPAQASWYCHSFYLSEARLDGMREQDAVAVALHGVEAGLDADRVQALVHQRTPELLSTSDPRSAHANYPEWVRLVASLRRLVRLRALSAPQTILDNEVALATKFGSRLPRSWDLPGDVHAVAEELGLRRP